MTPDQLTIVSHAVQFVCRHFDITLADLESHRRPWRLVWPRWCAITLVHRYTQLGYPAISRLFNRSYWAIPDALAGLEDQVNTDCASAREFASLDAQFRAQLHPS